MMSILIKNVTAKTIRGKATMIHPAVPLGVSYRRKSRLLKTGDRSPKPASPVNI